MTKEALWTKPFLLTGGVNFFQLFTQYILITTLPLCIIDEFHGSELEAGLAMTFFQIGTSVFRPVAGYLVDEKQKRRLLLGSLVLFFLVMPSYTPPTASKRCTACASSTASSSPWLRRRPLLSQY